MQQKHAKHILCDTTELRQQRKDEKVQIIQAHNVLGLEMILTSV